LLIFGIATPEYGSYQREKCIVLKKTLFWSCYVFLISMTVAVASAQADCPTIVEEALQSLADSCGGMERNSACYGANNVDSLTVADPRPEDFFVSPGDRGELVAFREIIPQPLNVEDNTFGVSVLNVQANVPNTLPGQAVLLLLMGDARVTNEVAEGDSEQSPFQSFYFLPGVGKANCYEAEPTLTVQAPAGQSTTIFLNGIETEFSPGTLLTLTPTVCTVHRGQAIRRSGTGEVILGTNQTINITINEQGRIVGQPPIRAISEAEFQRGEMLQEAINTLAEANDWEEFTVPEPGTFAPEPLVQSSCETQYTVRPGDSLYGIAEEFDAPAQGIVDANGLADLRDIQPGQVLCIPNTGDGFAPVLPAAPAES
jgi:LysM repeat protein